MRRATPGEFYRHCGVLELEHVDSFDELKTAYRRMIARWHPDRHHTDPPTYAVALERAKDINAAFEYLSEILEAGLAPPARGAAPSRPMDAPFASSEPYETRHTYQGRVYHTGFPDPTVVEVFVKSSNPISVGYDRFAHVLYIKFQGGRVYRYSEVPRTVFDDLLSADSHGQFAQRHIYRTFRYDRC